MFVIPNDFIHKMIAIHGPGGLAWIERLPTILATCEQRWGLTIGPPFAHLSYHYAAPAVRADGAPVVVKACSPTGEFVQEAEGLRLFNGQGMVQLLECDPGDEVLLLERLEPGTLLRTIEDDEEATSIAATVMRQLWRPVPSEHPFPTVTDWGAGLVRLRQHYGGGNGPFPAALLEKAEALFAELSASMAEPALLHGDLHHDNILAAQRQPWLAIDPKGLIGEPAYETGALLRNPLPELLDAPQPGRILARRVDQLAEELSLDRARVRGWGLAQAVLSAWWSIEDSGYVGKAALTCAELLAAIKV
jgi:streptomycin 6-kinase